jgi:hypothetical protein
MAGDVIRIPAVRERLLWPDRAYANVVYLAGERPAAMPRSRNSTAEQPGIRGGKLSNIQ